MKLELTCTYNNCREKIVVDWPEIIPGKLHYLAFLNRVGGDDGLKLLYRHHLVTRGLTSGHEFFEIGSVEGQDFSNRRIKVGDDIGIVESKDIL